MWVVGSEPESSGRASILISLASLQTHDPFLKIAIIFVVQGGLELLPQPLTCWVDR